MTEVEYITACSASCEIVSLRKFLSGLFDVELNATDIFCDNLSCIKLLENLVHHGKTKHIKNRFHYIRDIVQKGVVKLVLIFNRKVFTVQLIFFHFK